MTMTIHSGLVAAALAAYVAAFVLMVFRTHLGWGVYGMGFLFAAGAFALRWAHIGHAPLTNMYEALLVVAVVAFPLSLLSRGLLKVGAVAADPLIAALFAFPVAFILDPTPKPLSPALQSPLFVPHVLAYMIGYVAMAKAAISAGACLAARRDDQRAIRQAHDTYAMVRVGLPFLTIGLVLGAWWGKLAWGDYWNWDPKELWALATWLIYMIYLHTRRWLPRRRSLAAALVILGMIGNVTTLLAGVLARFAGLHGYAS